MIDSQKQLQANLIEPSNRTDIEPKGTWAMSNVIRFLESVGSKSLSASEYFAAVNSLDAGTAQKNALFQRDGGALESILADRKKMYCAVFAADEDN